MNRSELKRTPLDEKVDFVRSLARQCLQIDNNDWYICKILTKLAHMDRARIKKYGATKLTTDDLLFAQLLRDNGIKPHTAYTWFLLMRCSKEVRAKVLAGEMTQREALLNVADTRELPNRALGMEILHEIRQIMEGI